MTKTVRDTASAAEESFHKHHAAIWGEERWAELYRALTYPTRYAALVNRYAPIVDFRQTLNEAGFSSLQTEGSDTSVQPINFPELQHGDDHDHGPDSGIVCYAQTIERPGEAEDVPGHEGGSTAFPQARPSPSHPSHLMTHWNLDAASLLAAHVLDVRPGESVLDLCAAPGGKSIALAQTLWPNAHADNRSGATMSTSKLVCNEADGKRQRRLAENLQAFLPSHLIKSGAITTTKVDATQSGAALNSLLAGANFDKVLLDAPCSSERHIIHASQAAKQAHKSAPEMATWRASSSKRLASTQLSLLATALKAVKVGGQVLYATCSISPAENDGVIEKMLASVEKERKKGQMWTVELCIRGDAAMFEQLEQWAERTKYGWIVLPDHPGGGGWGPLFFCLLRKVDGR